MNVLMLSPEYSPGISGGVGTHAQELATGLARAGDTVVVLACALGAAETVSEGNKTVHLLPPDKATPPGAGPSAIARDIVAYNAKMARYARSSIVARGWAPDLVHCHNWVTFPAAHDLARTLRVPLVCTVHYVSDPIERWWGQTPDPDIVAQEVRMFREADLFIAVSDSMRSIIETTYGVPSRQIAVVNNGIDIPAFAGGRVADEDLARLRQSLAPRGQKIVLYAGRLHPHKGMSALLDSAAIVVRREPDVRYVIAGEPDAPANARAFDDRLKRDPLLREHMLLLGKLHRGKLEMLYRAAHMAVMPSVYDPFPIAAIEAMAAGVPLVASRCGGLADAVLHGETGLLVPIIDAGDPGVRTADVQAFADAITAVLSDSALAGRLSAASRRRAADLYGLERMVRLTREVYTGALHAGAVPTAGSAHA